MDFGQVFRTLFFWGLNGGGAILLVLISITTLMMLYVVLLGLKGYGKAKRDYEMIAPKARFLILVAAHNEEAVIASAVEDLRKITYDKDKFDIYVVNDNSTDGTEAECKRIGVNYINTGEKLFPREGVGKPGGLQYALRALGFENVKKNYDLVMILDADNHVDPFILDEVNSQWFGKGKPEAIQCYLDSKNFDNSISLGYASAYVIGNRFFQLAKYRLGLPNSIGGTGFSVSSEYLINSGGFNYKSLTEDLEMSIEIVSNHGRVLWNHFARVYDEKPEDMKISLRQRTRWMQGHWFVAFSYGKDLLTKLFKERKFKYLDQLLVLFSASKSIVMAIMILGLIVSGIILFFMGDIKTFSGIAIRVYNSIFGVSILGFLMMFYYLFVQGLYAFKVDSRVKYSLKTIFSMYLYSFTFIYCHVKGFIKRKDQGTWVKTVHTKTTKTE